MMRRDEEDRMKIGLYSITYLGVWYKGAALTLPELIERARRFGYDGIEIDGKRPHGNPLDLPSPVCRDLRLQAEDAGIEIYAVAANNDLSSAIPECREAQLAYIRDLIRMTADLGARTLRMFAAWPGITRTDEGARYDIAEHLWHAAHERFSAEQTWEWCREGLAEAAAWAGDAGVTLALQNHPAVILSASDMLRMIHDVGSPHLAACFDAPLARKQGETGASMRASAARVGRLQALTHFGGEYTEEPGGEITGWVRARDGSLTREDFYASFTEGMLDIGYAGYTGYELCHPLPKVGGEPAGIGFVDTNTRLAATFMRRVIEKVQAERLAAANTR
jgi:sugar phosphate isomerase/epimerase